MTLTLSEVPRAKALEFSLPFEDGVLGAELRLPPEAKALVLFAHGSGSSRRSPRNRQVADFLHSRGLGALCFDFLTPEEAAWDERNGALRFDIDLLARRMLTAAEWVRADDALGPLPLAFFGASTGAAAALAAAAELGSAVRAVVSRGGRPDLADRTLPRVRSATLLIVGGRDPEVLALNQAAFQMLRCEKALRIVQGATHLFVEPGALEEVSQLAADWFLQHAFPRE